MTSIIPFINVHLGKYLFSNFILEEVLLLLLLLLFGRKMCLSYANMLSVDMQSTEAEVNDLFSSMSYLGFPGGSDGKESACNMGDLGSIPGLGRSPGETNTHSSYCCLENSIQRCLVGYSPWGHKELNMTEWLSTAHWVTYTKQVKTWTYFWITITAVVVFLQLSVCSIKKVLLLYFN